MSADSGFLTLLILGAFAIYLLVLYRANLTGDDDSEEEIVPEDFEFTEFQADARQNARPIAEVNPVPELEVPLSAIPDRPQSFGYKISWFAIPSDSTDEVIEAFGYEDVSPANWETGMQAAYSSAGRVFFSPPVEGWVLGIGLGLPSFGSDEHNAKLFGLIEKVAQVFPDFCGFGTHRVSEFHCWLRVRNRSLERGFASCECESIFDTGTLTEEENEFGFRFFDSSSPEASEDDYWEREDLRFPDEEDVIKMAQAWSINPLTLHESKDVGVGAVAIARRAQVE